MPGEANELESNRAPLNPKVGTALAYLARFVAATSATAVDGDGLFEGLDWLANELEGGTAPAEGKAAGGVGPPWIASSIAASALVTSVGSSAPRRLPEWRPGTATS